MRGKQFVVCSGVLFLTGCGVLGPEEVVSDPDGPSSQAIMAEEIKTAGFSYNTQVESYDVHISGELQPESAQPLTVAFQLSGTVDNEEETFELDGDIQIENQTDETQTITLLPPLPGEPQEEYVVEVEPSQTFQTDITVVGPEDEMDYDFSSESIQIMDSSHFSDRVADSFQAISDYAGIEEKSTEDTTIRYSGTIQDHFEELFSAYWFTPYEMTESGDTPLDFELVVDAETMSASELVLTDEANEDAAPTAVFRMEFSNVK